MEKDNFTIKEGKYSIILGNGYYGNFIIKNIIQPNPLFYKEEKIIQQVNTNTNNKLIKITYINLLLKPHLAAFFMLINIYI